MTLNTDNIQLYIPHHYTTHVFSSVFPHIFTILQSSKVYKIRNLGVRVQTSHTTQYTFYHTPFDCHYVLTLLREQSTKSLERLEIFIVAEDWSEVVFLIIEYILERNIQQNQQSVHPYKSLGTNVQLKINLYYSTAFTTPLYFICTAVYNCYLFHTIQYTCIITICQF